MSMHGYKQVVAIHWVLNTDTSTYTSPGNIETDRGRGVNRVFDWNVMQCNTHIHTHTTTGGGNRRHWEQPGRGTNEGSSWIDQNNQSEVQNHRQTIVCVCV